GGLAWLGGALFVCLVAVAIRLPREAGEELRTPAPIERIQQQSERVVTHQTAGADVPGFDAAFGVARGLAMLCHLAVCAGLVYIGCRHFRHGHMGMAAATFYLLLPYTAFDVGRWHHVWPMALLVWAVALYRRPTLAGLLLGVASATVYFPVAAFPVWLSFYWRRGAGRFAAAFGLAAGVCLAAVALLLWTDDELARSVQAALSLPDWQPWREPISGTQGLWRGIHWAYRMPVFIAYLAMVATTAFWPSPKNLAHLIALTAANIIGIQFWYAEQGGAHVLWYLPLLLLLVFRPNLSDRQPAAIVPETDWLTRALRALGRLALRVLRPAPPQPQPAARGR
ncbi:MAG TPA: hypothetical protein VFA26_25145, partial [Gemmataceae bacterium]|nr:hypothetical protein [Gemmataceae bacterium]